MECKPLLGSKRFDAVRAPLRVLFDHFGPQALLFTEQRHATDIGAPNSKVRKTMGKSGKERVMSDQNIAKKRHTGKSSRANSGPREPFGG